MGQDDGRDPAVVEAKNFAQASQQHDKEDTSCAITGDAIPGDDEDDGDDDDDGTGNDSQARSHQGVEKRKRHCLVDIP